MPTRRGTARWSRAARHPGDWYLRAMFCVVAVGSLTRSAHAQECSTGICVGNPCTITGSHLINDGCFLDFGTKNVTISGSLVNAVDGGSFAIAAESLTVNGKLQA